MAKKNYHPPLVRLGTRNNRPVSIKCRLIAIAITYTLKRYFKEKAKKNGKKMAE